MSVSEEVCMQNSFDEDADIVKKSETIKKFVMAYIKNE